jgi:DNA-directed RNA polymerase subunit omega
MLDIDLEEELVKKVGGKFALTYLLQRRLVELNRGDRPLIEVDEDEPDKRRIACQEILEGKIILAPRSEIENALDGRRRRSEVESDTAPNAMPTAEGGETFGGDFKKVKEQRLKELSELLNRGDAP